MLVFYILGDSSTIYAWLTFKPNDFNPSEVPGAMIPVESFLRGLGVLVQRNFPVCLGWED